MSAEITTRFNYKPPAAGPLPAARTRFPMTSYPSRFSPGERVGTYEIQCLLDIGGNAEVYRAIHPKMGEVALKVAYVEHENYLRQEAIALSKLASNQNTVKMLGYGIEDGWHCLALEYVSGMTVKALLESGPIPLPKTLDIITQVCYGLNNYHQRGLGHLDVKPGNMMVDSDGKTTLVDAGNATPIPTEPTESLMATLAYCSPERLSGQSEDHSSDIFSLGLVFYTMLTGKHPFQGEPYEIAMQIKFKEVPMLPDTFHPQIRAIVGRATAHHRANRYQNVMDIVRDIRLFTENQ